MDEDQARRLISDCTAFLLTQRQFYGYLLQQMDVRHEPRLPAALAVGYDEAVRRLVLSFNPKFMVQPLKEPTHEEPYIPGKSPSEPWTRLNFVAGLDHECRHVLLGHLTRFEPGRLQNIATDLVINQEIKNLPRGLVSLASVKRVYGLDLPAGLHANGYLRLLQENIPPCPIHGTGQAGAGHGQGHEHGDGGGEAGEGEGEPCPHCSGESLDCHRGFKPGRSRDAEEAGRRAVGSAYRRCKEQQHKDKDGTSRGTLPSDLERLIEELLHEPVDWRHLLRRVGESSIKWSHRTSVFRPHRRYGALFPGRKPAHAGKVVVAVDTSGSVGDDLLAAFWAEIRAMGQRVQVCVVECDAAVHDAWLLRRRAAPLLKGGGGSDFRGVFDLVCGKGNHLQRWRQAVAGATSLVFLTDGDIAVPESCPGHLDVYWAIPENKKPPTTAYGNCIRLNVEQ
jgi:predicted metal-dependent peptidase